VTRPLASRTRPWNVPTFGLTVASVVASEPLVVTSPLRLPELVTVVAEAAIGIWPAVMPVMLAEPAGPVAPVGPVGPVAPVGPVGPGMLVAGTHWALEPSLYHRYNCPPALSHHPLPCVGLAGGVSPTEIEAALAAIAD